MDSLVPLVADVGIAPQVSTEDELVRRWLGRFQSPNTRRAYAADWRAFRRFTAKPLRRLTVGDVQDFGASLSSLKPATAVRRMAALRSLVTMGHRWGFLAFNVGAAYQMPAIKDTLAERIMSEEQVQRLLFQMDQPVRRNRYMQRDATLVRLLYSAGLRISEACGLHWRDLTERDDAGQLAVLGKGGKTRFILLPAPMWARLAALRGADGRDDPVFRSRNGSRLHRSQVDNVVKLAMKRANLPAAASAHWLRHAHASHALDRGCPVHVVQSTLGHASLTTTTRYSHARPGDSSARYLVA
jgi:integrase/recombinase XerD